MMQRIALLLAPVLFVSCGSDAEPAAPADTLTSLREHVAALAEKAEHDAAKVEVQHILISFAGAGTGATRSREEAEQLAAELFARVEAGEDFDALVREHTDDSAPGIYVMTTGAPESGEYQRRGMVPAFGNVGWRLEVGEVGVAGYDRGASPFGWHIIKRLS